MKLRMMRKGNIKGFTLVELIIVMAILALLAGLAAPKFVSVLSGSKTKVHNSNLHLIEQAAELYSTQNPDDKKNQTTIDGKDFLVSGEYLKEAPTNPLTGAKDYWVEINDGDIKVGPDK